MKVDIGIEGSTVLLVVAILLFAVAWLLPRRGLNATKMLHVPFTRLRRKQLTPDYLQQLGREYFVPRHVLSGLTGKHLETPADILRDKELRNSLSPIEFTKLLVPPRHGVPRLEPERIVSVVAFRPQGSQLAADLWTLAGNKRRVVISSAVSEVISVELRPDGEPDPATLRVGGFWWWEWGRLDVATRRLIRERLAVEPVRGALIKLGQIPIDEQPLVDGARIPIRKTAQLAVLFNSVTGAGEVAPGESAPSDVVYDPDGMDPDGPYPGDCSMSPDYPFVRCCTAHDYCYLENARGCDECARLECDLDFLKCMMRTAGPDPLLQEMAFIYFLAVRGFGDVGDGTFQYCEGSHAGGWSSINKAMTLAIGILALASAGYSISQADIVAATGTLAAAGGLVALMGKLLCALCGELEEWVEKCEEDRIEREKRCISRKRKCKGGGFFGWAKKAWCMFKYYTCCYFIEIFIRGTCVLTKVVYRIAC